MSEKWLEVWRASTILPGYIACIERKRDVITQIWKKMRAVNRQSDVSRHVSILLQADPGVGKTFLAQKLAGQLGFDLVQHDVTQMIRRDDLLSFFDMIATKQAESRKPVLVCVDEINAPLDGDHVYGAFLAPIEGGYYIRGGVKYWLRPCVWLFAGTGRDEQQSRIEDKYNDFESRLSLKVEIDYKSLSKYYGDDGHKQLEYEASLEQVYLGAAMIHDAFPDVCEIEQTILNAFWHLPGDQAPARRIRKLAWSLENVQHRTVRWENCSSHEWSQARNEWSQARDGLGDSVREMVKLDFG